MRNPTKKQVQKIIDIFKRVQPLADNNMINPVNMYRGKVYHTCQTLMCHGGWFTVGLQKYSKGRKSEGYLTGAVEMSKLLGFTCVEELEVWADFNPKLWGNTNGAFIFIDYHAFATKTGKIPERETLQHIINHWKKVQKRLPR